MQLLKLLGKVPGGGDKIKTQLIGQLWGEGFHGWVVESERSIGLQNMLS